LAKPRGVLGKETCVRFLKAALVCDEIDALARSDEEVVITFRADEEVLLQVQGVEHLSAVRTFCPEVIWHVVTFAPLAFEFWFVENAHVFLDAKF